MSEESIREILNELSNAVHDLKYDIEKLKERMDKLAERVEWIHGIVYHHYIKRLKARGEA